MSKFKMARSYEGTRLLKTDDLLTAVRTTCNFEGDLYVNDTLVMSCLGLSREDNTRRLLKYGITSYVNKHTSSWAYRYTDDSKNNPAYYLSYHHYKWDGERKVQFGVHDYSQGNALRCATLGEVFEQIRSHATEHSFPPRHVVVTVWSDLLGCQSFEAADWLLTEGEPVIYELQLHGQCKHVGTHAQCIEKIRRISVCDDSIRFEAWVFKPYQPGTAEFRQGEVVEADLNLNHHKDTLYLIDGMEGGIYTLRELDDYKASFPATIEQLRKPNQKASV
ncbi:hypothetical protein ACP26L_36605 (plasmid) [Paenibacillus sp. S-38]|uniref:hypothetical protein n=1 Tax=Paenibacillus sp. S-38 TaxID=3416710 RepID=UPI003CE6A706